MREERDWRCHRCNKLLGRESDGRLSIRFSGRGEYRVATPASATCHGCGSLNEIINHPGDRGLEPRSQRPSRS